MTTLDMGSPYGQMTDRAAAPAGRRKKAETSFAMRGRVVTGVLFAILLVGGLGGWLGTARLSGAVIGTGSVLVDQDLKVVQHIDGGVVREIAVRDGEKIVAGQLLLRLDDVQISAERAIVQGQLVELLARQARLLAERDGRAELSLAAVDLPDHPDAAFIAAGEEQLFYGNLANQTSRKEQLGLQAEQLREEINGLDFQKSAVMVELDLALADRERMRQLVEGRLIEASRLTDVERDIARLQGQQGENAGARARAESRINEVELQILALDGTLRTDAQRELRAVEAQIAELKERLAAAEERFARTRILAPVAGTINELNVTTLGGVISPAERLVTIVPEDADLSIEFRVAVNDIDQIQVGKPAKLRFSAFNQRTTPEVEGTIGRVSAAAQHDPQTGQSYYLAHVVPDSATTEAIGRQLVPGMPVEVFVQTEEQIAIAYFLKPFTDQVNRAMREE